MTPLLFLLILFSFALTPFSHAEEQPDAPTSASGAQGSTEKPRIEPDSDNNTVENLLLLDSGDSELLTLDTGKEGEKLVGFYKAEATGDNQGGIIIFPDENAFTDDPFALTELREGLADFGWHTLALHLPQIESEPLPERTLPVLMAINQKPEAAAGETGTETPETEAVTEDTAEEASNAEAPTKSDTDQKQETEPYRSITQRLGQRAVDYLDEKEVGRCVIMGIGTGAAWAADYVHKHQDSQDLRLLLIDARPASREDAPDLMALLPEIDSTVIDLHHSSDAVAIETNNLPARRLKLARQKRMENFHQRRMPAIRDNWKKSHSWLLRNVRGVLNTYVIKAEAEALTLETEADVDTATEETAPGVSGS